MTKNQESLLDDLYTSDEWARFTPSEINFLHHLDNQRRIDLSEKQVDMLHKLAARASLME